jgi:hypothetical protein
MIRAMRRLLPVVLLATLVAPATAVGVLTPGRTVTNPAGVTALAVTDRSAVFAVGRTTSNCGSVRLWDTATRGLWTFGERTIRGCEQGPSGGFGIAQVATSGHRAFWVTHIGGNFTDYQLWTATPTSRTPRRLAFATAESGDPPPILLGAGTRQAVPYAVGPTVTFVGESGTRLFRRTLEAPVRMLTSGPGVGGNRVLAALADGRIVLLANDGTVLRTDELAPGAVKAIALALVGPVVQVGSTVSVGSVSGGTMMTLPPGATMIDYRQRAIVYRKGTQVRMRHVGSGADALLQSIPLKPWQPMLFSTDSWGSAWAKGAAVSWRSGPLR